LSRQVDLGYPLLLAACMPAFAAPGAMPRVPDWSALAGHNQTT